MNQGCWKVDENEEGIFLKIIFVLSYYNLFDRMFLNNLHASILALYLTSFLYTLLKIIVFKYRIL